jgi:hypothetical protein
MFPNGMDHVGCRCIAEFGIPGEFNGISSVIKLPANSSGIFKLTAPLG